MQAAELTYYYERNGATAGPVPAADLPAQGVRRDTLVWAAGMAAWQAAGQVAALVPVFAAVPPPLPAAVPPPLPAAPAGGLPPLPASPAPVAASPAPVAPAPSPTPPAAAFAPDGYSLPLLGKFKDDHAIWLLGSGQPFGEFAANQDLRRLHEDGVEPFRSYQLHLRDAVGKPLLTLYKDKASLLPPRPGEVRIVDAYQRLLGTCRSTAYGSARQFLVVVDTAGREVLTVKPTAFGSRDWVLVTPAQQVVARVRRSQPASWKHVFVEYQRDRLEVIFEPATRELYKALGLSAVLITYLNQSR